MADDLFSNPGEGGPKITEFEGKLLLITPKEHKTEVPTAYGDKDCIVADVVVIDADDEPEKFGDMFIFQGRLIGQTKAKVGKGMVLGRLGKKESTTKGHNAAWNLDDPTDADKTAARAYLDAQDPFA